MAPDRSSPSAYGPADPPGSRGGDDPGARRSHAAIPVAVVLGVAGLILGRYTLLAPFALGLALLWAGFSFLSTRINPLSPHFYLTRKPSWSAVGVVFLCGAGLLYYGYWLFRTGLAPFLPHP